MEQDDDIDDQDQEDEQDVEYTEDDSNNNPDGEHLEETDRNGDNSARSMPNENLNDAANSTNDAQNADNHITSGGHHMKNSPSDEEFYGGPSTGLLQSICASNNASSQCIVHNEIDFILLQVVLVIRMEMRAACICKLTII